MTLKPQITKLKIDYNVYILIIIIFKNNSSINGNTITKMIKEENDDITEVTTSITILSVASVVVAATVT